MGDELWKKILDSKESIFESFDPKAIAIFEFLVRRVKSKKITKDSDFQSKFRKFYRMNGVGLSKAFRLNYFKIFENAKGKKRIDLKEIAGRLKKIKNAKGQKSLQFSFITKMANCLNQNFPIYDKHVRKAFGLEYHSPRLQYDLRIERYCADYNRIKENYEAVLREEKIRLMLQAFRNKFLVPKIITDKRILDFIVWTYCRNHCQKKSNLSLHH